MEKLLAVSVWTRDRGSENEKFVALYDAGEVLEAVRALEAARQKSGTGVFLTLFPRVVVEVTEAIEDAIPMHERDIVPVGPEALEVAISEIEAEKTMGEFIEARVSFAHLLHHPDGGFEFVLERKHDSGIMTGYYSQERLLEALAVGSA